MFTVTRDVRTFYNEKLFRKYEHDIVDYTLGKSMSPIREWQYLLFYSDNYKLTILIHGLNYLCTYVYK